MNLCKVQSNSPHIQQQYPPKEPLPSTVSIIKVDPNNSETLKVQALGLQWDIPEDTFSIKMEYKERPKTKRGFLGHIMSPYDPPGMTAPAMLSCKLLQREIFPTKDMDPYNLQSMGWDDPIPKIFHKQWDRMLTTINDLCSITMNRSYYPNNSGVPTHQQLHAFADASDLAICYAIYLRTKISNG